MEITLELDKSADIPFLKNALAKLKGIKNVRIKDEETNSFDVIENSPEFRKIIEKSRGQIKSGQYVEHSKELMDSIFRK